MPKYYDFKVAGYYLYFTSFCVVECMHVHASDSKFTEGGSAKFFVKTKQRYNTLALLLILHSRLRRLSSRSAICKLACMALT